MSVRLLTASAICGSLRLALCLLLAAAAYGQTALGTIVGRVTDTSDAVVPSATVELRNEATNVVTPGVTTATGDYVFANVNPGTYQLTFRAPGLAEKTISHVVLEVSQTVRLDATMAVGAVTSSVNVTAEHVLVQTDTTSVGGVIETKQVEQMPLNGRTNMFGLLALAPGVQNASANPRISGSSWIGTNATMDGMVDMETENARLSGADPSLDSVQEFRVIDSTGSAEYGAGAAQVIISTKSGTNQFHGSLFAYNRNRDLAAKNFFATSLAKAPYNRNEFGGSLGGPIKRDRLFFFGSYEGLIYHSSSTNQSAQPTQALLQGNFSGLPPVIDPYTGSPFPGNQIPSNRINPIATNLFPYFSTPNRSTTAAAGLGTNYVVNVPVLQHNYRYQGRVDYSINPNNTLFVRYFYVDEYNQTAGPTEKFGSDYQPLYNQNAVANYTRIISPTLVNVATFGWMRLTDQFLSQNHTVQPSSLIPGIPATYTGLGGIPSVSITGFTGMSDSLGSGDTEPTYQASDTLTWVKGRHTIKSGFSFLRYQFLSYGDQSPEYGAVSFNGQYTGNAFADFLLGYVAGSSIPLAPTAIATRNYRYGSFVQDDWRVNDHLTLNLGLRYDLPTRYENVQGGMANWYPQYNSLVVIKGNYDPSTYSSLPIISGSSVGLNTGNYIGNDLTQFAPRIGLAWRPLHSQRFVVRAGYGMYYDSMPWKFGSYELGANPPFSGNVSFEPAAGTTPSLLLNSAFPVGSGSVPTGVGVTALAQNYHYPLTHQWNFTMESQVTADTVLRATYLGDEREHSGALYPVNTPLPAPGPVQPQRPYQPFGAINLYENGETSNTQQLQLTAERRFARGLSFGIEYSWTKTLDGSLYDQSLPTVPNNIRLDRGNDPMIRQQYVVANYVYQLPFGHGQRFGSSMPKVVDAVLGGWETSGILTLASGLPFSVTFDSSVQGWPSSRADIVGKPSVASPSLSQWFNPAAYAVPAPFFYGNSAPNSLFGPGFSNWDTAAMKNFVLRERATLQFRAEFFNALNHPNFANPNSDISVPSRVGTITSTTGSPRAIQFALRLEF